MTILNPVSAYALSKVNTERDLLELADESFSPVFLRNATAFGVSPGMRFDLVLNNLMAAALTTGIIKVLSDGTPWRPLVHIEDISLAAKCALEAPRGTVHAQAYNVGRNDANYQVSEIAEIVGDSVPEAKLEITGEMGGDPRSYRVDFSKAFDTLPGFRPQWTLEKGCDEFRRWFQTCDIQESDLSERKYIRLAQLQYLTSSGLIDEELRAVSALVT